MGEEKRQQRAPGEGGRLWAWAYKYLAGPAEGVPGAVQGGSTQAREAWKRDLENRKRWSREQRERKRAEREARRAER
ncbi:hypothetical protein ABZ754_12460 [Micromonospora purpureochromogenes]|uniref:hypothetical protein n=1 Tax=Micromonospora TaxID=1873 RepID=UPI001B3624D5|nr:MULTISPECIES: hypothetical protein [unclassified Micromonospora]MBQ0891920.1 hypothetical protein [Micromonospora sp. U56]MDH6463265.1 hypothetical protein [Micromonospora sp. A200]